MCELRASFTDVKAPNSALGDARRPVLVSKGTELKMAVLIVEKVTWKKLLKLGGQECYRNYFVNPNCIITSWLGHLSSEQEIRDDGDFLVLK